MAFEVAVIEGEGAAPEVMQASVGLLERMGVPISWTYPVVGAQALSEHGSAFPGESKAMVDRADCAFFGATSGASAAALFYLRWGRQTYANVRPTKWRRGFFSPYAQPESIDFVTVRENLEDLYLFLEGEIEELEPLKLKSLTAGKFAHELGKGKYAIKIITEEKSRQVITFAFDLAKQRKRTGHAGKVTIGSKYNMLPQSDGLFAEIGREVAAHHPDIEAEILIIDDLTHKLIAHPERFDVLVLPNLYGDIISDGAAGLVGGLGLAPSGCYGADYAYFEAAHGTADDIAGKGIINPTATLLSAVMMLEHLGLSDHATRLENAIERVYELRDRLTPDQGGTATTNQFCEALFDAMQAG